MKPVPNKFPTLPLGTSRLALIGEAPGKDETEHGEPFVGASGRFLQWLLSRSGSSRESCFLGNVCQFQPPGNDISSFSWSGVEIQEGLAALRLDIANFNPNIVVLLGNVPLKAARDPLTDHKLNPKNYAYKNHDWRGSLFIADSSSPFAGRKCISTLHPAFVLRAYDNIALLQFDLKKAILNSTTPELVLPKREITIETDKLQAIVKLRALRLDRKLFSLDTEGIEHMSCISFAPSPFSAFVIPFFRKDGSRCWSLSDECEIMRAIAELLEDPLVPKIIQNTLHDVFLLHYYYGIRIQNVADDTMLKHWELYAEVPKALAIQISIYTDEPFYKDDRQTQDDDTFYRYCATDSLVTYEINEKLEAWVKGTAKEHYKLNMSLLAPLRYMELHGIRYDVEKARSRREIVRTKMFEEQARLNALTGCRLDWNKGIQEIQTHARNLFSYKRDATRIKVPYLEAALRLESLLKSNLSLSTIGEIEDLLEVSLNEGSTKQITHYLYETLNLPRQYKENKGDKEPGLTANYEALLKLCAYCKAAGGDLDLAYNILQRIIAIRAMDTRQRMLSISSDNDHRIRCGYNIVGSETGRITCYTSPTGSGYNLQTIPKYTKETEAPGGVIGDRDLFLADEGYYLFQCDLSGADGWTVAAYCALLGDDTMLEDYKYGLKPAKLLALLLTDESRFYNWKDRAELKEKSKLISQDDWNYFACKRVQHGANYLEGPRTICKNVLTDSEGKLVLTEQRAKMLRDIYFARYPGIQKWHNFVRSQLGQRTRLTAASGQDRQFFGRPDEILTKAVAHEPQANTTYVTNLAMHNLWNDVSNRLPNGTLRIQLLHQVHDALLGQFKIEDTAWAVSKIRSWFNNPIKVAHQTLIIPFEGGYGRSWGELKNAI